MSRAAVVWFVSCHASSIFSPGHLWGPAAPVQKRTHPAHARLSCERGGSGRSPGAGKKLLQCIRVQPTKKQKQTPRQQRQQRQQRSVTCSSMVLEMVKSSTTYPSKMCFTQRTTYSVSDSVSSTGAADRNTRPRLASSGT